jgi:hypothetical protein
MLHGKYKRIKDVTIKSYTIVIEEYCCGKLIYYNEQIVDIKSNLIEEVKERMKCISN